jgi:DNA polymerase-3 subunit epsilon
MSWSDGLILSFDTETTGTDPETARIVSAACLWRNALSAPEDRSWLVDPGVEIPQEAIDIHGITNEVAATGMDPADALPEIVSQLHGSVRLGVPVVIYNAPYDLTVVSRECYRYGIDCDLSGLLVVDPLVIDKAVDPYRKGSRKLVDVAALYHVPQEGTAHGATADALMAARLAIRLGRLPEIAMMNLAQLHEVQKGWKFQQSASFEAYLKRKNDALPEEERQPHQSIARDWPVLPRVDK